VTLLIISTHTYSAHKIWNCTCI